MNITDPHLQSAVAFAPTILLTLFALAWYWRCWNPAAQHIWVCTFVLTLILIPLLGAAWSAILVPNWLQFAGLEWFAYAVFAHTIVTIVTAGVALAVAFALYGDGTSPSRLR